MGHSDIYAKVISSTDDKPEDAFAGQLIIEQDTGKVYEWSGFYWLLKSINGAIKTENNPYGVTAHYYISTPVIAVAGGASVYFGLETATTDIVLISMNLQSASGETEVGMYEGTTFTGGTPVVPVNIDFQSLDVFPATYTSQTNAHTGGTLKLSGFLLGQNQAGSFADGSRLVNMRLKDSTIYTMQITNNEAGSRDVNIEWVLGAVQ